MTGRRALFIDGANLDRTARNLGFEIDYKRLLLEFEKSGSIVRSYFYLAVRESAAGDVQRLTDWLEVNRFTVRTKLIRRHEDEGRRSRRSIGIGLAIDALEIAPQLDELFLFLWRRRFSCPRRSGSAFGGQSHGRVESTDHTGDGVRRAETASRRVPRVGNAKEFNPEIDAVDEWRELAAQTRCNIQVIFGALKCPRW